MVSDPLFCFLKEFEFAWSFIWHSSDGSRLSDHSCTLIDCRTMGRFHSRFRKNVSSFVEDLRCNTFWPFFFACVSLSDSPRIDPLSPVRALVPGKPLVLNCTARGGPEPTITWYKDRKFVYQGQALVIRNETSSAHGLYTCRASNGIAPDDIASVTVTSLGKWTRRG